MAEIKKITSFTHHVTGEGSRLSATYSRIGEDGSLIESNRRFDVIVVDNEILSAVGTINDFLKEKIPEN